MPTVTIGGTVAKVLFAGLVSPGLYQFNVLVPQSVPNGDNELYAIYDFEYLTQAGVLITVRH